MTDEVRHTPGPWTCGPRGVSVYGPDNVRLAALDARLLSQRQHNARLMAAAPDLLAALEAALPLVQLLAAKVNNPKQVADTTEAIFAALAKAKGEVL